MFLFLLVFTIIIGWILFYEFFGKRRNLPPGPTPLPIMGNLIEFAKYEPGYEAFEKWKKEYGPVFTFWIGPDPFVVITDYNILKEVFIKHGDVVSSKFQYDETNQDYRGGNFGVLDSNGDMWKDHRRFAIHVFRDFGLGKSVMEEKIIAEVEDVIEKIKFSNGPINSITEILNVAVGSIINQLLFGYRFDEEHLDEFLTLRNLLTEQMRLFGRPESLILISFPKIRYVPHFRGIHNEIFRGRDLFFEFFNKQIEKHVEELKGHDMSADPTDYVDAYLREKRSREEKGDDQTFHHQQLLNMCYDLWIAGMETTSNTLAWGIVYILNNPEVQIKIHLELDSQVGENRMITMMDKNELPYMNAVINEIQRMANLLPINLLHKFNKDFDINGFNIKKGVGAIAQISSVLYDEEIFPEPHKFDPERFLDEKGNLKKLEQLVPFSMGKRQCLGEGLARMELFLFFSNLLNKFKFHYEGEAPSMKKKFGTTVCPTEFKCSAKYRW